MKWLAWSRRAAVGLFLLVAVLVAGGAYELAQMPSSIFPSVTFPIVKIIADVGDEPAARMVPTVTRIIEEASLRVPGVQTVRSTTSRGSAELSVQFAWGTDMNVALARVQAETERVRPSLPPNTKIDVEWMNPASFPVVGYALTSSTQSQAELWELAEYTLKPELVRIPGVSQVQIQGGRRREFEIRLDRAQLLGRNLSAADVVNAVRADDQVMSAGLIEKNHELYLVLVDGRADDLENLDRIAVPVQSGAPATLAELGAVATADEVSYVRTTADRQPAVLVNVVRQPSANTVAIASAVDALMAKRGALPRDVVWTNFYDQAGYVSAAVRGTAEAVLVGALLAFAVLFAFLRRLRPAVVAILTVPAAGALVALALAAAGDTVNLMTLAGFAAAIGLIVDDAIVVVENMHRHAGHAGGADGGGADRGVVELLPALVGSSLSTTVILLPFALLGGVVGAFFKPLALTMALSLAVSFILAALYVPVAAGAMTTREKDPGRLRRRWRASRTRARAHAASAAIGRGYDATVRFFLRAPLVAALAVVVCMGVGWLLYQALGTDFLPSMDEGSIILDYWTPPGTSLTDTDEMLRHVDAVVAANANVETYSRRTGTQLGFFVTEPNRGDYVIKLKPRSKRAPVDGVIDELRTAIARVEPAVHTDFGQLLEDNIGDLTGGTAQPIEVKLFGSDTGTLEREAKSVARAIGAIHGVTDVFDGITIAGPALDLRVDREEAARAQMTTEQIHAALEPAVTGTVVGQVRVGERMYDLRVLARGDGLAGLLVRTPSGGLVPATRLVTPTTGAPEAEIDRENLRTYVGVTARLSGRDLGSAMSEVRAKVNAVLGHSSSTTVRYGGLYAQQQASFRGLLYVLLGGLVLVAVVVLFEFSDWRASLLTMLIAVSTLVGVFGLLWLTSMTLNISSFVAAIMMVGIAGENSIFVIHEARLAERSGADVNEAWHSASRRRLRPVSMTILATGLALAPLALGLGTGSQLIQPLAIGVIGGFLVSGPLVLLVLPALYAWLDRHGRLGRFART